MGVIVEKLSDSISIFVFELGTYGPPLPSHLDSPFLHVPSANDNNPLPLRLNWKACSRLKVSRPNLIEVAVKRPAR